jgi:hypothetical protein
MPYTIDADRLGQSAKRIIPACCPLYAALRLG